MNFFSTAINLFNIIIYSYSQTHMCVCELCFTHKLTRDNKNNKANWFLFCERYDTRLKKRVCRLNCI